MDHARSAELTPELRQTLRKARRLEWLTIAYLVSALVPLHLPPPIASPTAMPFNPPPPTGRSPYGFHRLVSIAHLCSALALFVMSAYLLVESLVKLVTAEYPTINSGGSTTWP